MRIRVLTTPVEIRDGRISFGSAILSLPVDHNGQKKHLLDPKYDDTVIYGVDKADPVIVYLDESRNPKFSISDQVVGGWQSPTADQVNAIREAGGEIPCLTLIQCECQRQHPRTPDDIASLEQCGHASGCKHSNKSIHPIIIDSVSTTTTSHPFLSGPLPAAERPLYEQMMADAEGHASVAQKPLPEIPEGGLEEMALDNLAVQLQGTQRSLRDAAKSLGLTPEKYTEHVVVRQLARTRFTACAKCGKWAGVNDIHNPVCQECLFE